jgi:mono/diheme cytochrome c family protein
MPDGQLFATITHGVRNMPAYGPQIPAPDRWAIVGYVRALQMSQMAAATPSPPEPKK